MLRGAEFLAMILVVVYVGAVAVLFLFVVMMLDINFAELRQGFLQYLPIGALIGLALLIELAFIVGTWVVAPDVGIVAAAPSPPVGEVANTEALGRIIYTDYVYLFQGAGMVLLVAMVGAIVLTLPAQRGETPANSDPGRAVARRRRRSGQGARRGAASDAGDRPGALSDGGGDPFHAGPFGIFLNRKNVIIILMSIELMLLAVNINLVAFSTELGDLVGQVFALFVLTVAAAEAAIGLAILVTYYRNRGTIDVDDINLMKG